MSAEPTRPCRYESIDAWRGVACLAVVFFHSLGAFAQEKLWGPLESVRSVALHGWLGLHLFFVISGFCIFERLAAAQRSGETPGAFLADRARRIFPTYWAVILLSIVIGLVAMPFNGTTLATTLPMSLPRWLTNMALVAPFTGHEPLLIVAWTLTCEVSFYLITALLLVVNRGAPGLARAFIAGALLCVVPAVMTLDDPRALPLVLWPEFFAGACVSLARRAAAARQRAMFAASLAVLGAFAAVTFLRAGSSASLGHRFSIIFAGVLYALAPFDRQMMGWRVVGLLGWFGAFSYSLYLFHVPVMSRLMNLAARLIAPSSAAFVAAWLAALAATVLAGWLCWRFVEQPFERRRMAARTPNPTTPRPALRPAT